MQTNHENWTQTGVKSSALRGWVCWCETSIFQENSFFTLCSSAARDAGLTGYWTWMLQLRVWGHRWNMTYSTSCPLYHFFHTMASFANTCNCVSLDTKKSDSVCILIYLQVFYVVVDSLQRLITVDQNTIWTFSLSGNPTEDGRPRTVTSLQHCLCLWRKGGRIQAVSARVLRSCSIVTLLPLIG